jgi:hypothetical protein
MSKTIETIDIDMSVENLQGKFSIPNSGQYKQATFPLIQNYATWILKEIVNSGMSISSPLIHGSPVG